MSVPSSDPTASAPADTEVRPPTPAALLERLAGVTGMERGSRRLVLLLSQLGDFDSLEYAQALVPVLPRLEAAGIALLAIGIGDEAGRQRFCASRGFHSNASLWIRSPICIGLWGSSRA